VTTGPSTSASSRAYSRYSSLNRQEEGDDLLDKINVGKIEIPETLAARVLFDGYIGNSRMFVFASDFAIGLLQEFGSEIAVDGTFCTSPVPFLQIFTLSVVIDRFVLEKSI
jgi:hypothetical protein